MAKTKIIIGNDTTSDKSFFPIYNFHIAKDVRKKYDFSNELFSINGNVVFADFHAVRLFVQKLNAKRDKKDHVAVGHVNAAGLMDEIYHYLFRLYEVQVNPGVFNKAVNHITQNIGEDNTRKILFDFVSHFPPLDVYQGKVSSLDYLNSYTADRSNLAITLEELILLYFANFNPANNKLIELFDEKYFSDKELYKKMVSELDLFFQKEKKFGPDNQDMFSFLKKPIQNNPDNIEAQLDYIRDKYGILLSDELLKKILSSKDLIREDYKFEGFGGGTPTIAPKYKGGMSDADYLRLGKSGYRYALDSLKDYDEPEKFTKDTDWMPKVVIIAKNSYVWLDQLSKKYQRYIHTLDQIPDEELDQLVRWNFNGLWLIGIWERSSASKRIKHIMGNIDAVSSAYSLYDYQIANDLGGEYAYNNLNERARARGIRLASDMVPNHTGIFSKWMIEHPDYFIQSNYPPFPGYRFTGLDLSDDPSVQLRIEDGYWNRNDAAVILQRIDNNSGEIRYIYHGNDGTNMPWNDTAQLNLIRNDVREAVIQKILDVARKFSIIRFDAAMTLTKRHFSRLWYPEPGRGGDIPSRSDFGMTREQFDSLFPKEFWREVVDRINSEMPDTLLLAEAFWLMEGYFVRSLGMHRVYNSAFMHMLMKEENEKYRDLISNTLEFEPEILKRYVNFMSNPDEETAIKQFGTDDKYFGVCTLMVTLPGLPMFAHGQVEGFTEKYGMEYQRAYYNETPNQWLVERHEREIFPLMKKRYLFSHVTNFWLFDFITNYGSVDENVFAYSNSEYGERSIIFYNNKYQFTAGSINRSSVKLVTHNDGSKRIESRSFAEALNLKGGEKIYYVFREHISNLEYIKAGNEFVSDGFYIELDAFKYKIFLDFREIYDLTGDYEKLAHKLGGNGVPNIHLAMIEMKFEPIHRAFETIFNDKTMENFVESLMINDKDTEKEEKVVQFLDNEYNSLLDTTKNYFALDVNPKTVLTDFEEEIRSVHKLNLLLQSEFSSEMNVQNAALHNAIVISGEKNYKENSLLFMMWLVVSNLKKLFTEKGDPNKENYAEKLFLDIPIKNILRRLGRGELDLYKEISLLNVLMEYGGDLFKSEHIKRIDQLEKGNEASERTKGKEELLLNMLEKEKVKMLLGINFYEGIWYYSKENFEEMIEWMLTLSFIDLLKIDKGKNGKEKILTAFSFYEWIKRSSEKSEYKVEVLKEILREDKN